MRYDFRDMILP